MSVLMSVYGSHYYLKVCVFLEEFENVVYRAN